MCLRKQVDDAASQAKTAGEDTGRTGKTPAQTMRFLEEKVRHKQSTKKKADENSAVVHPFLGDAIDTSKTM